MSAMSDYLETAILNHLFRNTTIFAAPTTVYISLHTTDPTDAAVTTGEVSTTATGYVRVGVSTAASFSAPTDDGAGAMFIQNSGLITFATPTASWGIIGYFGVWSAVSAGNMYMYGTLTATKTIGSGDTVQFAATDLKFKMA